MPESTHRHTAAGGADAPRVALFVTCLADLLRPSVAFSSLALLQRAGFAVEVPRAQSCCGQPAYNSGDARAAVPIARSVIATFEAFDHIVAPSGSCAGMLRHHYPRLLEGEWQERARAMADKVWELTSFLEHSGRLPPLDERPTPPGVTYHDGCAGLRELGVREQPRTLLRSVCGIEITEMERTEVCCGFGGTFCTKMPDISTRMADDKLDAAAATGAALLTGGDLGCLLNLAGRARRRGLPLQVRHVAELLAGELDGPAIAEADSQ